MTTTASPIAITTETESTATETGASAAVDSHALASSMATTTSVRALGNRYVQVGWCNGFVLVVGFVRSRGGGSGELETACGAFLLCDLSSFLCISQGKRVSSLMTPARASPAPSTAGIFSVVCWRSFEVTKVGAGSTRRRCGRRTHAHVRHCRLITAM